MKPAARRGVLGTPSPRGMGWLAHVAEVLVVPGSARAAQQKGQMNSHLQKGEVKAPPAWAGELDVSPLHRGPGATGEGSGEGGSLGRGL